MPTQIGKAQIRTLDGAALGIATLAGYISPNLQSLRLVHNAEIDKVKGQNGNTKSIASSDDFLECQFDFIPEGSSTANAKLSAGIPAALAAVVPSGLPVIKMGGWADALNVTSGGQDANPWIYEGGAQINGLADGKWTATMTLRRYVEISSTTVLG